MKRKRLTEEQTIGMLHQTYAERNPDKLIRENGTSFSISSAWKAKFGSISVNEAQRLRALEDENRRPRQQATG